MTLLLENSTQEKQLTMEELLSMALQLSLEAKEHLKLLAENVDSGDKL